MAGSALPKWQEMSDKAALTARLPGQGLLHLSLRGVLAGLLHSISQLNKGCRVLCHALLHHPVLLQADCALQPQQGHLDCQLDQLTCS